MITSALLRTVFYRIYLFTISINTASTIARTFKRLTVFFIPSTTSCNTTIFSFIGAKSKPTTSTSYFTTYTCCTSCTICDSRTTWMSFIPITTMYIDTFILSKGRITNIINTTRTNINWSLANIPTLSTCIIPCASTYTIQTRTILYPSIRRKVKTRITTRLSNGFVFLTRPFSYRRTFLRISLRIYPSITFCFCSNETIISTIFATTCLVYKCTTFFAFIPISFKVIASYFTEFFTSRIGTACTNYTFWFTIIITRSIISVKITTQF